MTLYIANTTKQFWKHNFRIPEMTRPYYVDIPPGTQIKINENLGPSSEDCIIQQLAKYGGRDASSVHGKLEKFPGIFYRTNRPISVSEIIGGHEAVLDHQNRRAANVATKAAIDFSKGQRLQSGKENAVKSTEVEVIEEVKKGSRPTGKEVKFGLTVAEDGRDTLALSDD